jgi:hypothetical protein
VEPLAVSNLVAVDELLVREQVPVRVDDALREPGRPGGVVELRRVVGERVLGVNVGPPVSSSARSKSFAPSRTTARSMLAACRCTG